MGAALLKTGTIGVPGAGSGVAAEAAPGVAAEEEEAAGKAAPGVTGV